MAERTYDPSKAHRVIVIGGGLSGLAVAHRIQERSTALRRSVDLTLLEAKERLGGVIATERFEGFTLEGGPDSFITNKPWGLDLCRRLGLGDRLIETDPSRRRSFVVRKSRLLPVPEGFVLMKPQRLGPLLTTPILSWRGKFRMLMDLFLPRRDDEIEESVAGFVRRRFGREALDRLIQPLVAGIYTADPNNLSLKATLPEFPAMEREHRSIIRGALRQAPPGPEARRAPGVRGAVRDVRHPGRWHGRASCSPGLGAAGRLRPAEHGGSPDCPQRARIPLVGGVARRPATGGRCGRFDDRGSCGRSADRRADPALALQLRAIPYASSVIVNVAYRRDQIQHPLDGFGAVVPAIEGRPVLAVSFLSIKFPSRAPAGTVLLRVFIGGATQPELFDCDDAAIGEIVRNELAR